MKYTQNYNFRKPEDTDPADIQDLNYNADAIDGKLKEIEDWEAAHLQASNPHSITPALIGAETPTGAQQKANQAETNAKSYADTVANSALNSAKDYADDVLESANSHTDQVASDLSQKLNETRIKVLDVEQDVSNISKVLTNLNPNQEPTQQATGYGIVSLPKNAANGQFSAILKGNTWTNRAGIGDTSPQTIENLDSAKTYLLIKTDGGTVNVDAVDIAVPAKITGKTSTVLTWASGKIALYELSAEEAALDVAVLGQKYHYISGTKSTVSAMRLKSVSADESEVSTAYVVAKDEQGKIAELRSLPNGVKDEISITEGKKIQRTKEYILQASDIYSISTNPANVDHVLIKKPTDFLYYNSVSWAGDKAFRLGDYKLFVSGSGFDNANNINSVSSSASVFYFYLIIEKGTYADLAAAQAALAGTKLTYQLAEPIETPVQVSGTLVSYPSGTVYIEPFVADAGIYADKMEVLHQDLPIKVLEKLSKIDFTTGLETELDVSDAVIAEDNLSFTYPELTSGDIVFFVYEHGAEGTIPETEISYYDSRYVIKDSVTGKFYKWHIAVADGVPSIELMEV